MADNPPPPTPPRQVNINNSKGVVVGDNNSVVQNFLADKRLPWFLLAGGAVLLGAIIVLYFALRPRQANPILWNGNLHIAVANFSVQGQTSEKDLGVQIANIIFTNLKSNLGEMVGAGEVDIRGPQEVGKISGADAAQRAGSARKIAEATGAHVLVYGVVEVQGVNYKITPEFYVSSGGNPNAEDRELIGAYRLGKTLDVRGPANAFAFNTTLGTQMADRLRVLTLVSEGLSFFSANDYETALATLQKIDLASWPKGVGEEILYLLMGNSAGKIGQVKINAWLKTPDEATYQSAVENFDLAEQNYQSALSINADYPRALIGLGSVAYMRALLPAYQAKDLSKPDPAELEKSIQFFNDAARSQEKPQGASIDEKVHFGLGQSYLAQKYAGVLPDDSQAVEQFQALIAAYQASSDKILIQELTGDAHARLGLIYRQRGDLDGAIREYQAAVDLLTGYAQQETYQKSLEELKKAKK